MSTPTLHEAARSWVVHFPIFPITPNAKTPATTNGFKDATQDLAQIDRWWSTHPAYNIATCPDDSGYYVIDIDGAEGEENFMRLEGGPNGPFDPWVNFQVHTPSGGRHLWLLGRRPCSIGRLAPHIDIRGVGGYVLLPPSIINGRKYVFVES